MELLYVLVPVMILFGIIMFIGLFWALKSGQYDDMEGEANRILMDDDDPLLPQSKQSTTKKSHSSGSTIGNR